MTRAPSTPRRRLTSWKEIAAYLGREVRTVVRWEKERGLPVHRVPGGRGGSLFAYTDELDRWSAGAPEPPPAPDPDPAPIAVQVASAPAPGVVGARRSVGLPLVVILMLFAAGLAVVVAGPWRLSPGRVTGIEVRGRSLVAVDAAGREAWRYSPPADTDLVAPGPAALDDLVGDSRPDPVVNLHLANGGEVGRGQLIAFDASGGVRWQFAPEDVLAFGSRTFGPPWIPDGAVAYRAGGHPRIAWLVHHHTWWPSMLLTLDADGRRISRFVNSGWLQVVRPAPDGRHLLVSGVSNSHGGAILAMLPADAPSGGSPEEPGSAFACGNCGTLTPVRYLLAPWSDVARAMTADGRKGIVQVLADGSLQFRAVQTATAEFVVELSSSFELRSGTAGDAFWSWHDRLEAEGRIDHPRERCPHREGPALKEWTAAGGWRDLRVPARR